MSNGIQKQRETWYITNVTNQPLKVTDIPAIPVLKPNDRIDAMEYATGAQINASIVLRSYISQGSITTEDYLHTHDDKADKDHHIEDHEDTTATGTNLNTLTGGSVSDADGLHTHNNINNNISGLGTEIDNVESSLNQHENATEDVHGVNSFGDFVSKSGSVNQLSDITSEGTDIEDAVTKKHDEAHNHNHDDLDALHGGSASAGERYHLTNSQHDTLTDGSDADDLHKHVHNNLDNIQGGQSGEYYHLKEEEHSELTDWLPNVNLESDGSIETQGVIDAKGGTFGSGDNPSRDDFTEFQDDGMLVSHGDAITWEDMRVPISAVLVGPSKVPGFDIFVGGVRAYAFISTAVVGNEEEVFFTTQLPHGYKEGSYLEAHIHWSPSDGNPGVVRWGLEYTWANEGKVFPNTSTIYAEGSTTSTAFRHIYTDFEPEDIPESPGKTISSMLVCRLWRNSSHINDTYGSDAFVTEIDFHYQINTLGSREEHSKF